MFIGPKFKVTSQGDALGDQLEKGGETPTMAPQPVASTASTALASSGEYSPDWLRAAQWSVCLVSGLYISIAIGGCAKLQAEGVNTSATIAVRNKLRRVPLSRSLIIFSMLFKMIFASYLTQLQH
jgi:hypothetical protein